MSRLQTVYPEALSVHRLDYATSGLLIVARSKDVHRQLSKLFETRLIDKSYTAVASGLIETNEGRIDLPLICDWPNRPLQKVDFEQGKPSVTLYTRIALNRDSHSTRLTLTPVTGRSHQLRVHLQQIGHPILGDEFYAPIEIKAQATRLLLHATTLSFIHPVTNVQIELMSTPAF